MNRLALRFIFIIACMVITPTATYAAGISEANFTPQGFDRYDPVTPSQIEVFVYKPDFKFNVIGSIEARGMYTGGGLGDLLDLLDIDKLLGNHGNGEKQDIALAMQALKDEAAKAGAHAVIIVKSVQVRVSQDGSTERRIYAAAIRRIP